MNFGVFIKIFLTFTFSQQLRFDVAEVFGLLKVKLNLKMCTRRKPLLIFFLKQVVLIKIMNKNSKIHVSNLFLDVSTLELVILPKDKFLRG